MQTSNKSDMGITVDEVTKILGVDTIGSIPGSQANITLLFMNFESYKKALPNIKKKLGTPVVTASAFTWNYKNGQIILANDPSPAFEVMLVIQN